MKFIFRLDFGPIFGWGHLSRSIAIASALVERGCEVVFLTQSQTEGNLQLTRLIDSKLLEVQLITSSKPQIGTPPTPILDLDNQFSDAIETLKICTLTKADVIVLDHYALGPTWIDTVRTSFPVCLISDFPAETEVDYLIDYGFDATRQKHFQGLGSGTKFMLGTAFAPIAQSYSRFMNPPKGDEKEINRFLVSLGGFPEEALATNVLHEIYRLIPEAEIHIAGNPSKYSVIYRDHPQRNLTIAQEASLAHQFAISGMAIVGAGVTMYELVASGSLGLVIQTAKNQEFALSSALDKGNVRGLQEISSTKIRQKVAEEFAYEPRMGKFEWLQARSLVDHLGPARLAQKLQGQFSAQPKLRDVKLSDLPFLFRIANQHSSRAASPNFRVIEPMEHWDWSRGFFDGRKLGWVYAAHDLPLGHCRLEQEGSDLYLSYSIQEEFQGEGLGTDMLKALFAQYSIEKKVFARVRADNVASLRALGKVGFIPVQGEGELITLVRDS